MSDEPERTFTDPQDIIRELSALAHHHQQNMTSEEHAMHEMFDHWEAMLNITLAKIKHVIEADGWYVWATPIRTDGHVDIRLWRADLRAATLEAHRGARMSADHRDEPAVTIDVGHVHTLTDNGDCQPNCPHPDHKDPEAP